MLMAGSRALITTIESVLQSRESGSARGINQIGLSAVAGSESSNSPLSANQSVHFAYILEKAENFARNAPFFQRAAHRREPAHAAFARLGEHSLRAK